MPSGCVFVVDWPHAWIDTPHCDAATLLSSTSLSAMNLQRLAEQHPRTPPQTRTRSTSCWPRAQDSCFESPHRPALRIGQDSAVPFASNGVTGDWPDSITRASASDDLSRRR